jgi:hypothetical protein
VHPMARNSSASRLGLRWDDLAETPQGWKIVQLLWVMLCPMGFGGLEEKVGICMHLHPSFELGYACYWLPACVSLHIACHVCLRKHDRRDL